MSCTSVRVRLRPTKYVYVICDRGTFTGVLSLLFTWWEAMSKDQPVKLLNVATIYVFRNNGTTFNIIIKYFYSMKQLLASNRSPEGTCAKNYRLVTACFAATVRRAGEVAVNRDFSIYKSPAHL